MAKIYAHRGFSSIYPENSIEAIKEAFKYDYIYGIEIDIRMTKDKKFVVVHDSYINNISDGEGRICDLTLDELRKFNFKSNKLDIKKVFFHSFFHRDGKLIRKRLRMIKNKTSKIVTLEHVLNLIKDKHLLIEIKYKSDECFDIDAFYKLLKKYDTTNILIQSFSRKIINELNKKDSTLNLGILIGNRNIDNKLKMNLNFISIEYSKLTKDIIEKELKKEKIINVWTVDNYHQLKKLKKVSHEYFDKINIITNNPDIIKKYIISE